MEGYENFLQLFPFLNSDKWHKLYSRIKTSPHNLLEINPYAKVVFQQQIVQPW